MSLHFLLDGYNIIHQVPRLAPIKFDQQRRLLVQWIESRRPQGSLKNRVTIYFDGRPGLNGAFDSSIVEVKYTYDRSADDEIRKFVEDSEHKRNIIVVTNDRDIQYAVRANGASIWTVEEFIAKLEACATNRENNADPSRSDNGKPISKTAEYKINTEFEKIWLKDKNKGKS